MLLVDKPAGITSHDVVSDARRALHTRRIGHAGTLDPFATGLLVLLVGNATRLLPHLNGEPKVYQATIAFGSETDTDDVTGTVTRNADTPDAARVREAIGLLTGVLDQVPPAYSAKQVEGRRAYAAARRGESLALAPVRVTVHSWDVQAMSRQRLNAVITCGGGTYIRALARDLGRLSGSAAHLTALRRTRSGSFNVAEAMTLDTLRGGAVEARPPLDAVAHLPKVALSAADVVNVRHGRTLPAGVDDSSATAALVDGDGALIAVAEHVESSWQPRVVLPDASTMTTDERSGLPPDVRATVVTVGTFDGVHRGHRDVLDRLAARATSLGLRSVMVTFEPHPLEVVNPAAAPQLLTVGEEKREVLAESGIDYLAVVPFTPTLARYAAEEFVTHVLRERFSMQYLLMGYDHGFGRNREGDVEVMQALGARDGFRVEVIPPVSIGDGRPISSTSIRRAIAGGDLERAAYALGRPYSLGGRVVPGAARGRGLGFPTINLAPPNPRKLLPPKGVYAVRVQTPGGAHGGMLNLGPRPTFGDQAVGIEAHLFDTSGDWYGTWVRVDFISRLRDTQKFATPAALIEQLRRDEDNARRVLSGSR